ncbi:MAG: ABC transporter substrate-binding protein [Chloroflexi bacterium]|nr:ABC transporter substrate-binding protein [Chloroflexota bacterium]
MKKRLCNGFVLLFLVLLASLSGCQRAAPALTPVTVQLAWTHQPQFAGMYAADLKGYYAAEGLAVTLIQGGANIDKLVPVLDGTAQFSTASADELILARSEGKPLRAIATIFRRSPAVFVSLADKGITRPQDFVGKTISVPAIILLSLRAMMDKVGIAPDQYTVVTLPSDLTMFASGDPPVWGVFTIGFVVVIQQAGYKLNMIYPDDYGVHFYADTLFTTDNLISTNPDLVRRFLRATLKGWTCAVENPAEVPAMVQKYKPEADAKIELARMTASLPLVNTGEDHIGWMKPEMWAGMEKTLREQKVITAPVDVTQVYTMQFLQELYK